MNKDDEILKRVTEIHTALFGIPDSDNRGVCGEIKILRERSHFVASELTTLSLNQESIRTRCNRIHGPEGNPLAVVPKKRAIPLIGFLSVMLATFVYELGRLLKIWS